jgi:hypothetical protein
MLRYIAQAHYQAEGLDQQPQGTPLLALKKQEPC